MVFAALDPEIKQKVLSAYLDGHGRNQITRELHEQGIKISHGSVSNFINAYKRKHEQPPSPPEQQASSGIHMNIGESSPLFSGKGKATSVTPRDGGPLSHFFSSKDEDTMMTVPDSISSADGSSAPLKPQVEDAVINPPEEPNTPSTSSDLTYSPGWDPDNDQAMQIRFLRIIIAEREKHHQQTSLINKEKELIAYERRNLELEKKQLDYEQRNLETKLAEIEKYRDILPSAKKLRDEMGVDFHEITIWIEVILERSATDRISPKEAVSLIVRDLKSYNELYSLEKTIQKRQQDLEALNIAFEQTQQAYRSLVNLRSKGFSDTEIIELNKLINSRNAGGGWSQNNGFNLKLDEKLNLASPNGENNLQQPSNGYDDGNLSTNDLIKLNLLKGSTTNMLNRIGTTHMPSSLHF